MRVGVWTAIVVAPIPVANIPPSSKATTTAVSLLAHVSSRSNSLAPAADRIIGSRYTVSCNTIDAVLGSKLIDATGTAGVASHVPLKFTEQALCPLMRSGGPRETVPVYRASINSPFH